VLCVRRASRQELLSITEALPAFPSASVLAVLGERLTHLCSATARNSACRFPVWIRGSATGTLDLTHSLLPKSISHAPHYTTSTPEHFGTTHSSSTSHTAFITHTRLSIILDSDSTTTTATTSPRSLTLTNYDSPSPIPRRSLLRASDPAPPSISRWYLPRYHEEMLAVALNARRVKPHLACPWSYCDVWAGRSELKR
jgi:hypothetical protein